jgi:hypothetical protein
MRAQRGVSNRSTLLANPAGGGPRSCSTPYWVMWSVIHNTHGHEISNIRFPRAACFLALAPAA